MGYALHQSFYIRSNWLNKALSHLSDPDFFSDKNNHLKLGIGKNMFQSLRFWSTATNIAEKNRTGSIALSDIGELIWRYDPNAIQKDTLSVLHCNLCEEKSGADSWYWFFNKLETPYLSKSDLLNRELIPYVRAQKKQVSDTSLKKDIDCLVNFYTVRENLNDPEDIIYSPFSLLNLIEETEENGTIMIRKNSGTLETIGEGGLMYCLLRYLYKHDLQTVSVNDILVQEGLWGRVFNMNRKEIAEALNALSLNPDNRLDFIRTNNLDTIVCKLANPLAYLESFYEREKSHE